VTFELIQKAHGRNGKPRVKVLGTAPPVGGRVSLRLRAQQVLNKTITVDYSGNADFQRHRDPADPDRRNGRLGSSAEIEPVQAEPL
jgi:hypothetical protein